MGNTTTDNSSRLIVLVGFDGAAALDISGPHEVFGAASHLRQNRGACPYRLVVLADKAGPFRTASGLSLMADASWREFNEYPDTLLIVGGPDVTKLTWDRDLLTWLRAMAVRARRIGSICTGAFALAEAELRIKLGCFLPY